MYDNSTVGKYRYKHLPIGAANLLENFQQKMNDLFYGFEFIYAYIENLLIPTEGYWMNHVHNIELKINKLKGKGLKCNNEKSLSGKIEWNI